MPPPGLMARNRSGGSWDTDKEYRPPRPHVSQQARDHLEDLGLVDDDRTPDMRTPPAATRGVLNESAPTPSRED